MKTLKGLKWIISALTLSSVTIFLTGASSCEKKDKNSVPVEQRIQAVKNQIAKNPDCQKLGSFYWEFGDSKSKLASGNFGAVISPYAQMEVASASKWIFGAYAIEKLIRTQGRVPDAAIPYLNMTSGYDNKSTYTICRVPFVINTVENCANAIGVRKQNPQAVGKFSYGAAHFQAMAADYNLLNIGHLQTAQIKTEVENYLGKELNLSYVAPEFGAGVKISPDGYAIFLRNILSGKYKIKNYLGESEVVADPAMYPNQALASPISTSSKEVNPKLRQSWMYSLAHWHEIPSDVTVPFAYSSPGAFGFYPWIDTDAEFYGMIARESKGDLDPTTSAPYKASMLCGQQLRKAWMTGGK